MSLQKSFMIILPILASMASSLLGGSAVVVTRFVIGETGPFSLGVLRYGGGFLILGTLWLLTDRKLLEKKDFVPLVLLGLLFFSVFPFFFNTALSYTSASRAALVWSLMPISTMLIAAWIGDEKLNKLKIVSVAVATLGVVVALGDRASLPDTPDAWLGDISMAAACLTGSVYTILHKRFLLKYSALTLTAFGMLIGTTFLFLAASMFEDFADKIPEFSTYGWIAVFYLMIFAAALGFFLWNWALEHISATQVSICLSLNPLAALILATILLGEKISIELIFGMLMVIVGIICTSWSSEEKQLAHHAEQKIREY